MCRACEELDGRIHTENLQAHHIDSIEDSWDLRSEDLNCITLCPDHHELAESGHIDKITLRLWASQRA